MQIDRLFTMLLRRLLGPLLNRGIDHVARRGKASEDLSPEDRARARQAKQLARRARQAARLTRRGGRF
jgi:hypothetical protein